MPGRFIHHRVAGIGRTEIVEAHVLDAGFPPGEVPEREAAAARLGRIERRGKHVRAVAARLPVQNAPGLGFERNLSGSGLAVGKTVYSSNLLYNSNFFPS